MAGDALADDSKLDLLIELDRRRWRRQLASSARELQLAMRGLSLTQTQQQRVQVALEKHMRIIWGCPQAHPRAPSPAAQRAP